LDQVDCRSEIIRKFLRSRQKKNCRDINYGITFSYIRQSKGVKLLEKIILNAWVNIRRSNKFVDTE